MKAGLELTAMFPFAKFLAIKENASEKIYANVTRCTKELIAMSVFIFNKLQLFAMNVNLAYVWRQTNASVSTVMEGMGAIKVSLLINYV